MHDILPDETPTWQFLEDTVAALLAGYGYAQIRLPVVEKTALFSRSIGEVTDIVEKEMYTFEDRHGDSLTLRPEGTAGCVRAAIQQGLLSAPVRLWYAGPMFRYERPQKGRQRQFHQVGAEAFGFDGPDIDAELILMCARLWRQLGIDGSVQLQVNSIGGATARAAYRDELTAYLRQHLESLDEDSRRRLEDNPLRILDSKHAQTQKVLDGAPSLQDYLDADASRDFSRLCDLLDAAALPYVVNPRLVRGLDYYNKTVFEWVTEDLGAQGTVCAGGRYDGLVAQLGGKPTSAAGFALGMERLVLLLRELGDPPGAPTADIYVVAVGDDARRHALVATERLRSTQPDRCIVQHAGGGSFRSQMKKADKSGARVVLIWGEDELAAGSVTIKPLRGAPDVQQRTVLEPDLAPALLAAMAQ